MGEGCQAVQISTIECIKVERKSDRDAPAHIEGCTNDMVSDNSNILHSNKEHRSFFGAERYGFSGVLLSLRLRLLFFCAFA